MATQHEIRVAVANYGHVLADSIPDFERTPFSELKEEVERRWEASRTAEPGCSRLAKLAGVGEVVGHKPITETGSLNPGDYSFPAPGSSQISRFAFPDEASSKAAMEADFNVLASQIEDYAVDPDHSPLAFGTPDEQMHAMRVLAAWHGDGEPTRDLSSYCNAVEPMLKQSLAARGIEWDRARGAKTPDAAIAAAKDAASKSASSREAVRNVSR